LTDRSIDASEKNTPGKYNTRNPDPLLLLLPPRAKERKSLETKTKKRRKRDLLLAVNLRGSKPKPPQSRAQEKNQNKPKRQKCLPSSPSLILLKSEEKEPERERRDPQHLQKIRRSKFSPQSQNYIDHKPSSSFPLFESSNSFFSRPFWVLSLLISSLDVRLGQIRSPKRKTLL